MGLLGALVAHWMGGTVGLDSRPGRGNGFHAELPLPAVAADASVSELERARAAGMNGFLTKPIDPPSLHRAWLQALQDRPA